MHLTSQKLTNRKQTYLTTDFAISCPKQQSGPDLRAIRIKSESHFTGESNKIWNENFIAKEEKFAIIFYNMRRLFSTFIAEAILNNRAFLITAFL